MTTQTTRAPETVPSFVARIELRTGLTVNRIPSGNDDDVLRGAIIARSPHGCLVYVDCYGQDDETGSDLHKKCLLIRWSNELPAADADADGIFPNDNK